MTDHELLLTGKGALPFRFEEPRPFGLKESCLDIPKVIHQVWLGHEDGDPMPQKYIDMRAVLMADNPDWSFMFHTEADPTWMHNYDLFQEETNPGARSDLYRYEIVYKHGGTYLDVDFVSHGEGSLHPDMAKAWCSVSGPPWYNCNNAYFGFAKGSEFLNYVIANLRDPRVRQEREGPARMGPTFWTTALLSFGDMRLVHPNGKVLFEKLQHLCDANWVGK